MVSIRFYAFADQLEDYADSIEEKACEADQVNVTRGRDGARDVEILATSAVKKERTGALRFCRCQRLCGSLHRASLAEQ